MTYIKRRYTTAKVSHLVKHPQVLTKTRKTNLTIWY